MAKWDVRKGWISFGVKHKVLVLTNNAMGGTSFEFARSTTRVNWRFHGPLHYSIANALYGKAGVGPFYADIVTEGVVARVHRSIAGNVPVSRNGEPSRAIKSEARQKVLYE